jgi:hypothetical protein
VPRSSGGEDNGLSKRWTNRAIVPHERLLYIERHMDSIPALCLREQCEPSRTSPPATSSIDRAGAVSSRSWLASRLNAARLLPELEGLKPTEPAGEK